uniref:Uncharacterized protein n=1 Tax=Arundo donax TaxID=35708 RepID=A0A0A9FYK4_ARUDO
MTVLTNSKILCHKKLCPRGCANESKCNGQPLTVTPYHVPLFIIIHIVENWPGVRHIASLTNETFQSLQLFIYFI